MVKNNPTNNIDTLNISEETISKLKQISKKQNISIDELILKLLDNFVQIPGDFGKKGDASKQKRANESKSKEPPNKEINLQVDLSKFFTFGTDIIELLRRIAQSAENIERSHEKGWTDQRIDLGALSKKLDKLL